MSGRHCDNCGHLVTEQLRCVMRNQRQLMMICEKCYDTKPPWVVDAKVVDDVTSIFDGIVDDVIRHQEEMRRHARKRFVFGMNYHAAVRRFNEEVARARQAGLLPNAEPDMAERTWTIVERESGTVLTQLTIDSSYTSDEAIGLFINNTALEIGGMTRKFTADEIMALPHGEEEC
jgi:hypothetical protein